MQIQSPLSFQENGTAYLLNFILIVLILLVVSACSSTQKTVPEAKPPIEKTEPPSRAVIDPEAIPETPREMRAAWIATVDNIDWPSEPALPVAEQKAELCALLDRAKQLNLNAVIFQVRPTADALYESSLEPWSEFLTGKQGRAPEPYYDPLAFAIEEAHHRGLELHAWFNPFRAWHFAAKGNFAKNHIKHTNPDLVLEYGRYWWLDPGRPEAREHTLDVILDVVKRYDIDGVHLDDYFYPYAEKDARGQDIPFPDTTSYRQYIEQNNSINKGDWRRQNINRFVENLYNKLKEEKPHVRFGISPFGIWRPGHPPQIEGYDAYANIYADARKWIREGWVDYLSPQLYWPVDQKPQSFSVLLKWWQQQNRFDRHMWPGLYTSRAGNSWKADEINHQIERTREQPGATGNIHFSMKALMHNYGNIADKLLTGKYNRPALVPATTWISGEKPQQPEASLKKMGDQMLVQLPANRKKLPWLWVLKTRYGQTWQTIIIPGWQQSRLLPAENKNGAFTGAVISIVDRLGNESTPQMLLPVLEKVENPQ